MRRYLLRDFGTLKALGTTTADLAKQLKGRFPQNLDGAPFLLPGEDSAVRPRLMRWLDDQRVHPHIAGEFDDGALMKAFGEAGAGVFVAPSAITQQMKERFKVVPIGSTDAITEQFYAISVERKLAHPAVLAISSGARLKLFADSRMPPRKKPA